MTKNKPARPGGPAPSEPDTAPLNVRHLLPGMPGPPSAERLVLAVRKGRTVVRIAGRAGADLAQLPIGAYVDALEAAFVVERRAVMDPDGEVQRAAARTAAANLRRKAKIDLARQVQARAVALGFKWGYRKVIAREQGIRADYVSKLLNVKIED